MTATPERTDELNIFELFNYNIENYKLFNSNHFDYIVFDEAHRIAASSYQKIFNYFKPNFC